MRQHLRRSSADALARSSRSDDHPDTLAVHPTCDDLDRLVGGHDRHSARNLACSDDVVHAKDDVSPRGDVDRVDVDAGLRHHEGDVTESARLIQNPDDDDLTLGVGDPGRVERVRRLVRVARDELNDTAITVVTSMAWRSALAAASEKSVGDTMRLMCTRAR